MKGLAFIGFATVCGMVTMSAWPADYCVPEVRTVTPGTISTATMTPPSDAVVLFDGRDLSQWKGKDGPAAWEVQNGVVTVKKGSGDIETKQSFHDIQLHIEWRIPEGISGEGQKRGNSGIFIQGRYEIQVLDSYQNRTYPDGQAGAIYSQSAPLVNAMRKPGEWNVYEVIYTAPRFNDDGSLFSRARMTVLQNGVLIQNDTEIQGNTGPWGKPGYYEPQSWGPIRLQDHPDPSKPISYRNIWIRELGSKTAQVTLDHSVVPAETPSVVSTMSLKELLDDPATHDVLSRCLPELLPSLGMPPAISKMTLGELQQYIVSLTDAKLQIINTELARVHPETPKH